MQWTYSGNPAASPRDELRFLLDDVNHEKPLLSDGECDYLLFQAGDFPLLASINGLQQLIMRCRNMVDQSVGSVSVSWSQRTTNLQGILAMRREQLVRQGYAGIRAGGLSVTEKQRYASQCDLVQPQLTARQDHLRGRALSGGGVTTSGNQLTGVYNQ